MEHRVRHASSAWWHAVFRAKGSSQMARLDTAQTTETQSARTTISTMCGTRSWCMVGHCFIGPLVQQSLSDECLARLGGAATVRLTCSGWASAMSGMVSAVVELALTLAMLPGSMRSAIGWAKTLCWVVCRRFVLSGRVGHASQPSEVLVHHPCGSFDSIVTTSQSHRFCSKASSDTSGCNASGFVWRLSKKASSLPKLHEVSHIDLSDSAECASPARSVHARETVQLNNIVCWPPPPLPRGDTECSFIRCV